MEQQTAVEWLIEQILEERIKFTYTDMGVMWEQRDDLFEQAKAMEKEQIEKVIDDALNAYGIIKK